MITWRVVDPTSSRKFGCECPIKEVEISNFCQELNADKTATLRGELRVKTGKWGETPKNIQQSSQIASETWEEKAETEERGRASSQAKQEADQHKSSD